MITIQKYTKDNEGIEMSILYTDPYLDNSKVVTTSHLTEESAQNTYFLAVWTYFNYGIERFINHTKTITSFYFDKDSIPYFNDNKWRANYWELLKTFELDLFCFVAQTIQEKANYIIKNQQILLNAVSAYREGSRESSLKMVEELIILSKTMIKNENKIIELKNIIDKELQLCN